MPSTSRNFVFRKYMTPAVVISFGVSLMLWVGYYYFPWVADDLYYRMRFRDYFINGGDIDWAQAWEAMKWRHFNDNSRLASFAMLCLQFLPKMLTSFLSGVASYLSILFAARLSGVDKSASKSLLVALLFVVAMPWVDQMYVLPFQMAYLWGGAFGLVFAYVILENRTQGCKIFLFALFLGVWQEAIGFPAFVAVVAMYVFYPKYRDRRTVAAIAGLLAGLAWLYLSPGGQSYRSQPSPPFSFRFDILAVFAVPTVIFLIFCLTGLFVLWRKRRMRSVDLSVYVFLLIASLTSVAVMLASCFGPRVGWFGVLTAVVGLVKMLNDCFRCRLSKAVRNVLSGCAVIFIFGHLAFVDLTSYRNKLMYDSVVQSFRAYPEKAIYVPMEMRNEAPLMALQKPYFGLFTKWHTAVIVSAFHAPAGHESDVMKVLPARLEDFSPEKARKLAGDNGFYSYKNLVVGPYAGARPASFKMKASSQTKDIYYVPFQTVDSLSFGWYVPNASTLESLFHPIPESMEFISGQ